MRTAAILICIAVMLGSCTKQQPAQKIIENNVDARNAAEKSIASKETIDSLLKMYSPDELRTHIKFHQKLISKTMGKYDSLLGEAITKENHLSGLFDSLMIDSAENRPLLAQMFMTSGDIHSLLGDIDAVELQIGYLAHEGTVLCMALFQTGEVSDTILGLHSMHTFTATLINASYLQDKTGRIKGSIVAIENEMDIRFKALPDIEHQEKKHSQKMYRRT